jgi:hypothetical protein
MDILSFLTSKCTISYLEVYHFLPRSVPFLTSKCTISNFRTVNREGSYSHPLDGILMLPMKYYSTPQGAPYLLRDAALYGKSCRP